MSGIIIGMVVTPLAKGMLDGGVIPPISTISFSMGMKRFRQDVE